MSFKVEAITETKPLPPKEGQQATTMYVLNLAGIEGPVKLFQPSSLAAPTVGTDLAGEIEDTSYGKKLKVKRGGFGGGGGRNNPEDLRQRAAQGALSNTVQLWIAGEISKDQVPKVFDWFYKLIREKAEGK